VLVATVIMAVAVAGLMSAIQTSLRSASRLTDYDRAVLLGRQKMDELLISIKLPRLTPIEGAWDPATTGGLPVSSRARLTPLEAPPNAGPGTRFLERLDLEISWPGQDQKRRSFSLEGFRSEVLTADDIGAGLGAPR